MSVALSFRDVALAFPGKERDRSLPVLEGIDLEVAAGELVCLVGPSGCGKSTLLNVAGGFLAPSRGEVLADGVRVTGPDPRRIFIFQECAVFPWLTVEENIGFGLGGPGGLPAAARRRVVERYVALVGLAGFERAYPRELSGGMKQRVELARALAAGPDVLFMDEPFGALDYLTRLRIRAELIDIWQRGRQTVLFVTHDVEEAVQLADRIVVLAQRPATVRSIVPVRLERPRDPDDPVYREVRDAVFASMGMDHLGGRAGSTEGPIEVTAAVR